MATSIDINPKYNDIFNGLVENDIIPVIANFIIFFNVYFVPPAALASL